MIRSVEEIRKDQERRRQLKMMPRSVDEIKQEIEQQQQAINGTSADDRQEQEIILKAMAVLEKELKDTQKLEKEGATGIGGAKEGAIVAPQNCKVMVGFNMASAGNEAKELTQFLNARGFETFSTCVYCPATPGSDWKKSTNHGINNAKVLVTLITKGWIKSDECRKETNTFQMLMNVDKDKSIIPVNFPGITITDYRDPDSVLFNMMTVQQIDGAKPNWMEDVLQGVRIAVQ